MLWQLTIMEHLRVTFHSTIKCKDSFGNTELIDNVVHFNIIYYVT